MAERNRRPWREVLSATERGDLEQMEARAAILDAERREITNAMSRLKNRATQRVVHRLRAGLPLDGNDYRYTAPKEAGE